MATLITGGCGFIGTHVVHQLREEGRDLVILGRSDSPPNHLAGLINYASGDFGDTSLLRSLFDEWNVTKVIHLAASTVPATSHQDPAGGIADEVAKTVRLLDLCVEKKLERFIFLSSGGTVYGIPQQSLVAESHPTDPISPYGVNKLAIEKYLHLYKHLYGLSYAAIRAANPFGPWQLPRAKQGVIAEFIWRIMNGDEVTIWGDGGVVRDYFHVADLAGLCSLALDATSTGVFNAGSGTGRSLSDLIPLIETELGCKAVVHYEPGRAVDVPRIVLDIGKATDTFGWEPRIAFEEGLRSTCDWFSKVYQSN